MSARLCFAIFLAVCAVGVSLNAGLRAEQGVTVAAAVVVVVACVMLQARWELLHALDGEPKRKPGAVERHQEHVANEAARASLSLRTQKLTHLEQLEAYLEDRKSGSTDDH